MTTLPEPLMQEVIFRGTKSFPLSLSLTETVNVDITFVEHKTSQNDHFVEVVCVNIDASISMQRIYVSLKTINDLINQEELDKHQIVSKITEKSKDEFPPLSQASMRSLIIQKLLDLLTCKENNFMELLPLNTVQLGVPMPENVLPYELACRDQKDEAIFEEAMEEVNKEAVNLDSLTKNIKELDSQMSTSVNSLVTTFEKNILDSFTTETLEQAAQEIVDDSLIKKGQRKRLGKLVVLEDLTKTWELNEKRDRAAFLERLFKDGPVHKTPPNLIQDVISSENQSSGSYSPHIQSQSPRVDTTSSPKYSPRLTPLLFTPALPNSL